MDCRSTAGVTPAAGERAARSPEPAPDEDGPVETLTRDRRCGGPPQRPEPAALPGGPLAAVARGLRDGSVADEHVRAGGRR